MATDVVTATSAEGNGRRARFRAPARALVVMTAAAIAAVVQSVPVAAAPSCDGREATIVGTDKADKIVGTPGDDVIHARAGADDVWGRGGADRICGGPGKDELFGESGADRLFLNKGRQLFSNEAYGGDGPDFIRGQGVGGHGDDVLIGTPRTHSVHGGDGNDVLKLPDSYPGFGTLVGDAGADRLFGGTMLFGGAGDDELSGDRVDTVDSSRGASDSLRGGPGADRIDGGVGSNCVDYQASEAGVVVDLVAGTALGEGVDSLTRVQIVLGSRFDDELLGGPGPDSFAPWLGDDSLDGREGDDAVWFAYRAIPPRDPGCPWHGPEADEPTRRAVDVDLAAGTATGHGHDTLIDMEDVAGTPYADMIRGNEEANFFFGVQGFGYQFDTLHGRGGNDLLDGVGSVFGDEGDDRLVAHDPLLYEDDPLDFDGGAGSDWFVVRGRCSGWDENATPEYRIDLSAGAFQPTSSPYGPIVPASLVSMENVLAGGCDEVIIGDNGANILDGGSELSDDAEHAGQPTPSNDTIRGKGGDDEIYGRNADDFLYGGDGVDSIDGGSGSDTCEGENETNCEDPSG